MKIRNISGLDLWVPWLGRDVKVDEVVEVPDDDAEAYTVQEETWAEAGSRDLSKAELEALAEARGLPKSGTKAELIERLNTEEK